MRMTKSEAIKIINGIEEVRGELPEDGEDVEIALMMAKDALEEVERYRAIGRFEEVKWIVETHNDFLRDFGNEMEELRQYRAIGTVEEFAYAKRKVHIAELATEHIDKMEKTLKDYEAIGTIERFRELTEKAEPKKGEHE